MVLYYETVNDLYHHGIKGQKWGVRRTREELGYLRKSTSKTTVRGHDATPKKSTPNTTIDHMRDDGKIDVRTFYDSKGLKRKDIHTTNHGHPKHHSFGNNGEHVVVYEWFEDGRIKNKRRRDLNKQERKENADIL